MMVGHAHVQQLFQTLVLGLVSFSAWQIPNLVGLLHLCIPLVHATP